MSRKLQSVTGITVFALVGIYSWIMMVTAGAASYAWIILVAAIALLAVAGRAVAKDRGAGGRGTQS
jgi:hypothetical protein